MFLILDSGHSPFAVQITLPVYKSRGCHEGSSLVAPPNAEG